MHHIRSDKLFLIAFETAIALVIAGIGFTFGRITFTPPITPTPTPTLPPTLDPTLTSEPKAGFSDYASLFTKIDKNQFPIEQYHMMLTDILDCMPHLFDDFDPSNPGVPLTETESAALRHFMVSGILMLEIGFRNAFLTPPDFSLYQTLTVLMQKCPSSNVTSEFFDQDSHVLRRKIPREPQYDPNFRSEICKQQHQSGICDLADRPPP